MASKSCSPAAQTGSLDTLIKKPGRDTKHTRIQNTTYICLCPAGFFQQLMYIILHIFLFKNASEALLLRTNSTAIRHRDSPFSNKGERHSPWTLLHTGAKENDKYVLVHALVESRIPNPHTNYMSNYKTDNSISLFLYSQRVYGVVSYRWMGWL